MPKVTKAEPRNAWEDTYFPPAAEPAPDVPIPVHEDVYVSPDKAYTHRLNIATMNEFEAWCKARKLGKGPVIAAALREYMARHGEG
jgi:hypothetical protein